MNAIPNEMKNIRPGVIITSKIDETLYSVLLEADRETMYFPNSCLEFIAD